MVIIGIDAERKALRTGEAIIERTSRILRESGQPPFTATHIEVIGAESLYGPHARTRDVREVTMRVVANHPQKAALAMFSREIAPAGTSWAPGTTGPGGGRPPVSPLVRPFSFLLDKSDVPVTLVFEGERHPVTTPTVATDRDQPSIALPAAWRDSSEPTKEVRLIQLAYARSGDKGDLSNIGLVARRPEWMPLLWDRVTPQAVRDYFSHLVHGAVERFYLPGTASMNLVLHDALDGGGPSSMRMDPLGKGMAQMLLDMTVTIPASIALAATERQSR
jgi:hypothetical protein